MERGKRCFQRASADALLAKMEGMARTQAPVTWLMPVKNGMPYLPQTLESIANQTYRNHKILVRDDGSTDDTLDELKRWIPGRIPGEIFSGPGMGVGRSLAFLIDQAKTEYCARIDADDINMPDRLEKQVEFLRAHSKVGAVGSQVKLIDENGAPLEEYNFETDDAEVRWLTRYACRLCHPAVMLRRSVVIIAGNYRNLSTYEDTDLWVRMSRVAELANLPERLLCYRRFEGSVTGKVEDWLAFMRRGALLNSEILFPGIKDGERAMDLWDATVPQKLSWREIKHPAKWSHLKDLKKSAILMARESRKPDDYFTSTQAFREQYWLLKRRVLSRWGLAPLLRLRDRAASARTAPN